MNLMGKKKEAHYPVVATEGGTHLEGRDPKYLSDQFLGFFPTQYDGSPPPCIKSKSSTSNRGGGGHRF